MNGPIARTHADRRELVEQIEDRLHAVHGEDVRAIGLLGSTARGDDGPYSDVEVMGVLAGSSLEVNHEWCTGPWKAEVNLRSLDVLELKVDTVDVDWPITHGKYLDMEALRDPERLFDGLRARVRSQSDDASRRAIQDSVVGEQYELLGKLRNAHHVGDVECVPLIAVDLAKHAACMAALVHRRTFSSSSKLFQECLTLPHRPPGLDALCELAMGGDLADLSRVVNVCERYWAQLDDWLTEPGIKACHESTIPF